MNEATVSMISSHSMSVERPVPAEDKESLTTSRMTKFWYHLPMVDHLFKTLLFHLEFKFREAFAGKAIYRNEKKKKKWIWYFVPSGDCDAGLKPHGMNERKLVSSSDIPDTTFIARDHFLFGVLARFAVSFSFRFFRLRTAGKRRCPLRSSTDRHLVCRVDDVLNHCNPSSMVQLISQAMISTGSKAASFILSYHFLIVRFANYSSRTVKCHILSGERKLTLYRRTGPLIKNHSINWYWIKSLFTNYMPK